MAENKVNTTNEEEKKNKKRLFIIFGSILGAGAIAGASVGIYFATQPKAKSVKVDVPTIEGLTFKNQEAYIGQDYNTQISIDITKTGEKRLPDELKSVKSGNRTITDTEYTYDVADDKKTADFKIPGKYVEGDIKIDLELVTPTPPGPTPWYLDSDYLNSLTPDDVTKEGGEIQTLKVNGLDHKVRLIGVGEDYEDEAKTKPIHTTWEFVNLISDENGFSLATQWNDTNDSDTANHKYDESTIHNALNGVNVNNVLWAQKGATTWSSDYNCSVLDMLNAGNPGFSDAIKTTSKIVNIYNSALATPAWEEKTVEDKLFLLTPKEMGETGSYQEVTTSTYSYYANHTATDLKSMRMKNQISETQSTQTSKIPVTAGQTYQGIVFSCAGYYISIYNGGFLWNRSPNTNNSNNAWNINEAGELLPDDSLVYGRALAVAPAFCI